MYYRLDARHHVLPATTKDFVALMEGDPEARRVAEDTVDGKWVSTVFLGLDHQYGDGPPLVFETMVFHDGDGREEWRYSTWDEAVTGHQAIVAALREGTALP